MKIFLSLVFLSITVVTYAAQPVVKVPDQDASMLILQKLIPSGTVANMAFILYIAEYFGGKSLQEGELRSQLLDLICDFNGAALGNGRSNVVIDKCDVRINNIVDSFISWPLAPQSLQSVLSDQKIFNKRNILSSSTK